jgi:hypothetical protein
MFLKKGIDKAAGQDIYPHPAQTSTGNCAAYTGAACLYAFGLDHESKLIPDINDGTEAEKFQYKISKMVERLTALIYTEGLGVAAGYRKYIDEAGLACKFDVTEVPVVVWGYNQIAGKRTQLSNLDYIMDQMKRCQDIMLHIEWDVPPWYDFWSKPAKRHSIGLVGEVSSNEIVVNNPWGQGTIHKTPADAAANTAASAAGGFTPYKLKVDEEGYLHIDFFGNDARVYECVMICPATPHVVTLKSSADIREAPANSLLVREEKPELIRRYEYALTSATEEGVNGLAVALPGLSPENVIAVRSPRGWTSAPWYRGRDTGFDQPAPGSEAPIEPNEFTGIIWRTSKRPLGPEVTRDGFAIEVVTPGGRERADLWEDDPLGHAVVLREDEGVTTAWHVSATSVRRKRGTALEPTRRDDPPRKAGAA